MREDRNRNVEAARAGDETAMAFLMEEAWPVVFRYLTGLGVPDADTADLVQEALIRGMSKLDQFRPEKADLHTWLCTISRNLFLDLLKKRKHESTLEDLSEGDLPTSTMAGNPDGGQSVRYAGMLSAGDGDAVDLQEQLSLLPQDVRFAVLMRYVHGYTNKNVARMLGIPEGTVKSKIHYGLGRLRKGLALHA